MSKEIRSRFLKYLFLKKWQRLKKIFYFVKKSWNMLCNSSNFQHIEKILRTYVDSLVL